MNHKKIQIDILTLFPAMFAGPFSESILFRAQKKELVKIAIFNLRDWSKDKHRSVDDKPFGGGAGMVLLPEPLFLAIESISAKTKRTGKPYIILLSPQGKILTQKKARELSQKKHLLLICGHYEGIDERIIEQFVDEEISIGDYVLTGGELPAMVLVDSIIRLIPGVLEKEEATRLESFSLQDKEGNLLLESPQYTRPVEFRGQKVPEVLISGNHQKILQWKTENAVQTTRKKRPELLHQK